MADFLPQASTTGQARQGHEANVLVVKGLIFFAVVLIAVGFVVEYGLVYVMRDFSREEQVMDALAPPKFADDSGPFPAPRLQAQPSTDFAAMKAAELRRLNGYGWVDRARGIAHIPIDRAMDIVASSGLSPNAGADKKNLEAAPASQPAQAADKSSAPDSKGDRRP